MEELMEPLEVMVGVAFFFFSLVACKFWFLASVCSALCWDNYLGLVDVWISLIEICNSFTRKQQEVTMWDKIALWKVIQACSKSSSRAAIVLLCIAHAWVPSVSFRHPICHSLAYSAIEQFAQCIRGQFLFHIPNVLQKSYRDLSSWLVFFCKAMQLFI